MNHDTFILENQVCFEIILKSFCIHLSTFGVQYYLKIDKDCQSTYVRTCANINRAKCKSLKLFFSIHIFLY